MKIPLLFTVLTLSALPANEFTIKSETLETTLELEATLLPGQSIPFRLEPKQWSQFVVAEIIAHGKKVSKGDVLISFKKEEYSRQLEESKETAKVREIALAKAERELADLKVTTPHALEGLKLAHDRSKEALDYFEKTGRDLQIEDAQKSLEAAQLSLGYQEEELEQLLKMYKEDGITEETEEIILTRQRARVDSAKFSLKKADLATTWTLEKTIPRQAVDLRRAYEQALVAYETGKLNLPRALEEKILSVAKARRDHAKSDQDLADLEEDGKLLTLEAPTDGIVYYGEIKDGSWSIGNTSKFLFESGTAPANTTLMTLVPSDAPLVLHGNLEQSDYLSLSPEATGTATVAGLNGAAFPVQLVSLDSVPDSGGRHGLEMEIELPEDSPLVAAMKAKVSLVTYRNEEAISIPSAALTMVDGKASVKLKMADGKYETREVETGRSLDGKTEILKGLEVDQVIILSDPNPSQ